MIQRTAIEYAERLLKEALAALRRGHYTIAETKSEQAFACLKANREKYSQPDGGERASTEA